LWRLVAFVFYTGSAGGLSWCVLLFGATIAATGAGAAVTGSPHVDLRGACANMSMVFGYVLCYCLTTAALRRLVFKHLPTPALSVIAAFLGIVVWVVPYLTVFLTTSNPLSHSFRSLLASPMVLTTKDEAAKAAAAPFVVVWLSIALAASLPWGLLQWWQFTPYRASDAANDDCASAGNGPLLPDAGR
jgi:hypothetical protein